jgi:hypothetical protein
MMRTPAEELEALARDQREHVLKYVSNDVNAYVLMPRDRDPSSVHLADIRPGSDLRLHDDGPPSHDVKTFRVSERCQDCGALKREHIGFALVCPPLPESRPVPDPRNVRDLQGAPHDCPSCYVGSDGIQRCDR